MAKVGGPGKPAPKPGTFTKPPVIAAPSPNFNDRGGKDIDTIVLHHTASNNVNQDLDTLRSPKSEVSAHYLGGRDGKIYQLVNDQKRAWHAGKRELHGVPTKGSTPTCGGSGAQRSRCEVCAPPLPS